MKSTFFVVMTFNGALLANICDTVLSTGVSPEWPWITLYGCGAAIAAVSALTLLVLIMGRANETPR